MLATLKAFAIRELLESLATFGSILMLGVGVYIILLAFFQKSDDHS
jgi:hypothetical protein